MPIGLSSADSGHVFPNAESRLKKSKEKEEKMIQEMQEIPRPFLRGLQISLDLGRFVFDFLGHQCWLHAWMWCGFANRMGSGKLRRFDARLTCSAAGQLFNSGTTCKFAEQIGLHQPQQLDGKPFSKLGSPRQLLTAPFVSLQHPGVCFSRVSFSDWLKEKRNRNPCEGPISSHLTHTHSEVP